MVDKPSKSGSPGALNLLLDAARLIADPYMDTYNDTMLPMYDPPKKEVSEHIQEQKKEAAERKRLIRRIKRRGCYMPYMSKYSARKLRKVLGEENDCD